MEVMEFGMSIEEREEQPENAESPISVIEERIVMEVREEQPEKASPGMEEILLESVIDSKREQLENASLEMDVMGLGTVTVPVMFLGHNKHSFIVLSQSTPFINPYRALFWPTEIEVIDGQRQKA